MERCPASATLIPTNNRFLNMWEQGHCAHKSTEINGFAAGENLPAGSVGTAVLDQNHGPLSPAAYF